MSIILVTKIIINDCTEYIWKIRVLELTHFDFSFDFITKCMNNWEFSPYFMMKILLWHCLQFSHCLFFTSWIIPITYVLSPTIMLLFPLFLHVFNISAIFNYISYLNSHTNFFHINTIIVLLYVILLINKALIIWENT